MRLLSIQSWLVLSGLTLGALMLTAGMHPALAQYGGLGPSVSNPSSLGAPRVLAPPKVDKKTQEPDALPGAVSRGDRVAPAQSGPIADPTAALFDAINRGDIASARDAIDRGADLDGPGILGMTPVDLSVDLGRNDITFLLLSLHNGDVAQGRHGPAKTAQTTPAGKQAAGKQAAAHVAAPAQTRIATRAPAPQAKPVASAAPVKPTLVAGDGGTPNPAVGFLGFGAGHPSAP
jgi:hypothetical protein